MRLVFRMKMVNSDLLVNSILLNREGQRKLVFLGIISLKLQQVEPSFMVHSMVTDREVSFLFSFVLR